jgi:hypothetical protein
MKKLIIGLKVGLILLLALTCWAAAPVEQRLFFFEKSYNPNNIMIVYAMMDESCSFIPDPQDASKPLIDFYWLMDRNRYKPTHPLIKKGVRERMIFESFAADRRSFKIKLSELKELDHDLPDSTFEISAGGQPGACTSNTLIKLGKSYGNQVLAVTSVYSEVKTCLGVPCGAKFVELRGRNAETGKELVARYMARK